MTKQEKIERYVRLGGRWVSAEDKRLVKAVEVLEANYERAKKLEYVRNTLAYALYQTWRTIDKEKKDGSNC